MSLTKKDKQYIQRVTTTVMFGNLALVSPLFGLLSNNKIFLLPTMICVIFMLIGIRKVEELE